MFKLDCLIWEFTLACNMNCKHCGSKAGKARENELTTQECYKLCEDLASLNCNTVCIMGGEPFMRDDWYLVAECVKDLGMDLSFVSNGILLPEVINKLDRLEPSVVGISLDGKEQTHDQNRVKGSYKSVLNAIDLLNDHNIQTTVITAITKQNFNEILDLKDIVKSKKVNWQLQIGLPFGNLDPKNVIDEEEYYASAMFLKSEGIKNKHDDKPIVGAHCYGYYSHILFKDIIGTNGVIHIVDNLVIPDDIYF